MSVRAFNAVHVPKHDYICHSCRLRNPALRRGPARRHQHTDPPDSNGGQRSSENVSAATGMGEKSGSRSRIGEIIRGFMFKDTVEGSEKDLATNGSKSKTHGTIEEEKMFSSVQKHLVVPNPYAGSDEETLQQILQQKFSAQRRKDLLTLQSGQAPKVANEKEVQDQASAKIDPTDSSQSNTKLQAARSGRKRKTEVMQKQEAKRERKVARSQKANTKLARQLGKAITIQTSIEKTVRENPSNSDFVDPEPQEPEKSNNDDNILEIKELNGKKRKDVSVDLDQNKTSIEEIGRKNPSNSDFVDPEAKRKAKREAKRKAKRESKRERKVARSQKANIELAKPLGNAITIQTSIEKTVRKTSNSDFVDPEPQKPEKSNNDDTTLEIRELDGRKRKDVNVDLDQSKTSIEEIVRENPFNSDFVDPEPQKPEKSNNDETTLETREPDGKKGKDVSVDLDQGKASNLVKPTTTTPTSDNISNTQQSSREQSNSVTSPGGSRSEETSIEDFFRNASFGTSLDYKLATNSSRVRKVIRVPEVTIRKLESGLAPKIPLHNAESLGQLATETSNQGKVKAYKKVASVNDNNSPRALLKEHESAKTKHNATKFYNVPGFDSLKARLGQKSKKPSAGIEKANAADLQILPVEVDQPPVPSLAYGLERVLFNPGIYQLQDPRSRVYNFDPYLQKIMPVAEFDFSALKEYITSSRDEPLKKIASKYGKRYVGSTSSMTGVLAHFHFLLSQWRPIDPSMLSKAFPARLTSFTEIQRTPSAIFLRWKDGSYAIDADKQFANANILSMLGKSMEKLLTLPTNDFERYRKSNPNQVTDEEQFAPESYHYSTLGDFLMRSQLDAHDSRLPGTGMFDLKTRAVVSIRMDVSNYEYGVGYQIKSRHGEWESYEREYYDMIRSAFLKYSMQVRMGRMDGIFVAFHNIERIFGFQYISLPEMDSTIHGQWDTSVGDQEFKLSLDLLNKILDRATRKYPETSLRIHFETRDAQTPFMYIFAEPVTEAQVAEIQSQNDAKIEEFERSILGLNRGDDSETQDTQEDDHKWESIQANVQEAMDKDEMSLKNAVKEQETSAEDTEVQALFDRPEVFEEIGEGDRKDQREPDATRQQETTGEATIGAMVKENARILAEANSSSLAEREEQTAFPSEADKPFLDSIVQELAEVETASESEDVLAMTLTIRNKVNGKFVLRPEKMTAADTWSIEYSLAEVPTQVRARALYQACQIRRKKKLDKDMPAEDADADAVGQYITNLRSISTEGREWRKEQDERDRERPVQMWVQAPGRGDGEDQSLSL